MLASGASELLSLGAVLPFLAALSNPQLLFEKPIIRAFAGWAGLTNPDQVLLMFTSAFAAATVLAAVVRLFNLWLNGRLAAAVGSDLSSEVYKRTLYQPYAVHVQRNSAVVINAITSQIGRTVLGLNNILQLSTASVVASSLLIGLVLIDWKAALVTASMLTGIYAILASITRRKLSRNGKQIASTSRHLLKALQEGLGAIRDVLLDGSQAYYLEIYRKSDRLQRKSQAQNNFLSTFPRYTLEALGLMAIAILGGLLVSQRGSSITVIPILGALALGAQRLLPAFQQIYSGWASLKYLNADLAGVLEMLGQPLPPSPIVLSPEPLLFTKSIKFRSVQFRYQPDLPEVLKNFDLEIFRGERIGLIGSTGSGKSTTIDLLMGLLEPTAGQLLIDANNIHDPSHPERLLAWRAAIAHVPQAIYLADSSIAENIAFGIPKDEIDMDLVREAARQAQIGAFIESSPDRYSTFVGERGIRLSGGQRQRIGIARALYKRAQILVFDEATSALDNETERAVMHAIDGLSKKLTIVMIAHRLSSLKHCDRVIRLHEGRVLSDGPPEVVLGGKM